MVNTATFPPPVDLAYSDIPPPVQERADEAAKPALDSLAEKRSAEEHVHDTVNELAIRDQNAAKSVAQHYQEHPEQVQELQTKLEQARTTPPTSPVGEAPERGMLGKMGEGIQSMARAGDSLADIANAFPVVGQVVAIAGDIGAAGVEAIGVACLVADRALHGEKAHAMGDLAGGTASVLLTAVPYLDLLDKTAVGASFVSSGELKGINSTAQDYVSSAVAKKFAESEAQDARLQTQDLGQGSQGIPQSAPASPNLAAGKQQDMAYKV